MKTPSLCVLGFLAWLSACGSHHSPPQDARSSPETDTDRARPSRPESFPVRWSDQFALATLSELDRRLAKVEVDGFGELSKQAMSVRPQTCDQWSELHREGFEPTTTVEEQPDGFAKIRCRTLALLRDAKPAKSSAVRDLKLEEGTLAELPAAIASAWSSEEVSAVADATRLGKSFQTFNPRAHGRVNPETRSFEIAEVPGQPSTIVVAQEAEGDFNRDDVDDVVISVINLSGGSASQFLNIVSEN
jgi:hypothetical protein